MRLALFTVAVLLVPALAMATIVEVPPDDYLMYGPSVDPSVIPGDVIQIATAPQPEVDRILIVWTIDGGTGPRDVHAGVLEPNTPAGEILVFLDDTEGYVRDPAVAFDAGTGQWLIVWAQEHSPGEYEIYGRLMYPDGTLNPAPIRMTTTGTNDLDPAFDALQPAVCSNDAGVFLVAWAADDDAYGLPDGGTEIFWRKFDARDGTLGPVTQQSNVAPIGGASLQPELIYFYSVDSWFLVWEADGTSDPNLYVPSIYGAMIQGSAPPRTPAQVVNLSASVGAGRRVSDAARNPAIALDRMNQECLILWDRSYAGAQGARLVEAVLYGNALNFIGSFTPRSLDVQGAGPNAYVRDPAVTHNRISGTYVIGWRESLNMATGDGQTLYVVELDPVAGFTGAPFPFVNQGVLGVLPTEFGPPVLEGGWRANGRTLAVWAADASTKGFFYSYGQGFDLAAAVDAPPAAVVPKELALGASPNPFNPKTSIELALPVPGRAQVDIYDVRGRLVRSLVDEEMPAGTWMRTWNGVDDSGKRVASGVYMVRLRHPGGQKVTKVALVE